MKALHILFTGLSLGSVLTLVQDKPELFLTSASHSGETITHYNTVHSSGWEFWQRSVLGTVGTVWGIVYPGTGETTQGY